MVCLILALALIGLAVVALIVGCVVSVWPILFIGLGIMGIAHWIQESK